MKVLKVFLRELGKDNIQYFTHKNRFNYDVRQIRIDNVNKTYEFGSFSWTNKRESTQNGKEFERLVNKLKEMGYTEIKKPLKEARKPASPYSTFKYYRKGFNDRTLRGKFHNDTEEEKRLGKIENKSYRDEIKSIKSEVGEDSSKLGNVASSHIDRHSKELNKISSDSKRFSPENIVIDKVNY